MSNFFTSGQYDRKLAEAHRYSKIKKELKSGRKRSEENTSAGSVQHSDKTLGQDRNEEAKRQTQDA